MSHTCSHSLEVFNIEEAFQSIAVMQYLLKNITAVLAFKCVQFRGAKKHLMTSGSQNLFGHYVIY